MIRDLEGHSPADLGDFDVCIVGAGPSGISLALELLDAGLTVCLAEGGGEHFEPESQALYQGQSVGHPMALDEGRYRVLGGAATQWGGRCTTLDAIDFETRPWLHNTGWPITLDDLTPYYERAKRLCNFQEPWSGQAEAELDLGVRLPDLESADVETYVWRMPPPDLHTSWRTYVPRGVYGAFDWGQAYRWRLENDPKCLLLLHANCVGLRTSEDGSRVEAVEVQALGGARTVIKAGAFALCAGGIENVRLLLDAPQNLLSRVNPHGALGRYFMQHPRGAIATIAADHATARRLQKTYNHFWHPRWAGPRFATGFALSPAAQREHGLLNASAFIHYHPDASWEAGKRLGRAVKAGRFDGEALADAGRVLAGLATIIPNALRVLITARTVIHAQPAIDIVMDCEQDPDPESRITLSEDRDALGMRRARVDWRFSDLERRTGLFFAQTIAAELERLGLGKVTPAAWLQEPGGQPGMEGTYHFMGATRMSDDPRTGVVDANCRAHGTQNLYLAGASVFPTAGHANPTLSIVALTVRLADQIKADIVSKPTTKRASDPARPRILVTGASGFIGGYVCEALQGADLGEVVAGVRRVGSVIQPASAGIERIQCDVFDRASLAKALDGVSVVINCARDDGRAGNAQEVVRNILEIGAPMGLKRLVQFSSVAVYGEAAGEIDEETPPVEPVYPYGQDKRAADELARALGEKSGVEVAVLRPTLVYGPGGEEWTGRFMKAIKAGRLKRLGAEGAGNANLIFVRDLADFAASLATAPLSGFAVFNVNGAGSSSFDDYFAQLSNAMGRGALAVETRSPRARNISRRARRLARALVGRAARFLPPLRSLAADLRYGVEDEPASLFAGRRTYRTDRAQAAGFKPQTSLEEGIAASVAWDRQSTSS